jgi:hypothetical protein
MTVRGNTALWRKALALVPVLLVLASVPEHFLLRCRMDGELRAACCCHAAENAETARSEPALSNACCCDRVVVSRLLAPFASGRAPAPAVDVALPAVGPAHAALIAPEPLRPAPRALQRGGPAREGPALLVLKQTFLI